MATNVDGAFVRVRNEVGGLSTVPLRAVCVEHLVGLVPVRSLTWYSGQRSFPGWYWSSTMRAHVQYDSRIELSRLLIADFDPSVEEIVAQPFQLVERHDSVVVRRQIPDFLLVHSDRTVTVVNVKTPEALADEGVRSTFDWVTAALATCGWRHEVWTGADPVLLANVRFLAGFRRPHHRQELLASVAREGPGHTVTEVERMLGNRSNWREIRPAVFHLLWRHILHASLDEPLSAAALLLGEAST
ncbi:TnsA-like heteromeric transposase endonuclease subunit [Prescottella equi]|uniref:TnsA-like heteromeric transposase endonuclease subunit n=1 Tax=Rhodococcus hoagii TaxID=43767 RepID=UPI0009BFB0B4|nr:TnsA-like heteromeric transposase endonuclease subunit [Prescottella equi]